MTNVNANEEVSFLWTLICIFTFCFLSVDFYYSFFEGKTLMMRHARHLMFSESPLFFVFTVIVKFIIYIYVSQYLYKRLVFYKKNLGKN